MPPPCLHPYRAQKGLAEVKGDVLVGHGSSPARRLARIDWHPVAF